METSPSMPARGSVGSTRALAVPLCFLREARIVGIAFGVFRVRLQHQHLSQVAISAGEPRLNGDAAAKRMFGEEQRFGGGRFLVERMPCAENTS